MCVLMIQNTAQKTSWWIGSIARAEKTWTTIASTERDRRPSSHFSAHSFFTNKLLLFSSCAASLCVYAGWRERRYYCVRELEINIKFHVFALEKRRNNFSIGFNSFISPESWKRSGIEKFAKFLASSRLWLLRDFSQKKNSKLEFKRNNFLHFSLSLLSCCVCQAQSSHIKLIWFALTYRVCVSAYGCFSIERLWMLKFKAKHKTHSARVYVGRIWDFFALVCGFVWNFTLRTKKLQNLLTRVEDILPFFFRYLTSISSEYVDTILLFRFN